MKKEKNNNVVVGVLVVIIIGLLLFIGLIFSGKIKVSNNLNDDNKQGTDNSMIMNNKDAKYLVSKYMHDINSYMYQPLDVSNLLHDGLTDKFKVLITIMNADNLYISNVEPGKISEEIDCLNAFPNVKYKKADYSDNVYIFSFDNTDFGRMVCGVKDNNNYGGKYNYDELNKVYKYLFGNDTDLPKTYVSKSLQFYAYSEKYNAYINLVRWGGGPTYTYQYYDVSDVNDDNNSLEIKIKFLEFDYRTNDEKLIYNSTSGKKYEYTYDELYGVEENYMYGEVVLKDIYAKEIDNLDEYKFTFEKENDHYYLKSIKKV